MYDVLASFYATWQAKATDSPQHAQHTAEYVGQRSWSILYVGDDVRAAIRAGVWHSVWSKAGCCHYSIGMDYSRMRLLHCRLWQRCHLVAWWQRSRWCLRWPKLTINRVDRNRWVPYLLLVVVAHVGGLCRVIFAVEFC